MKTYQVGPKVKGNIKETFNLQLGPKQAKEKDKIAHQKSNSGLSTDVRVAQAHRTTGQRKAV
jgi:hypothetical protein